MEAIGIFVIRPDVSRPVGRFLTSIFRAMSPNLQQILGKWAKKVDLRPLSLSKTRELCFEISKNHLKSPFKNKARLKLKNSQHCNGQGRLVLKAKQDAAYRDSRTVFSNFIWYLLGLVWHYECHAIPLSRSSPSNALELV